MKKKHIKELPDIDMEDSLTPALTTKPLHHLRGKIVEIKRGRQDLGLSDEQWSQFILDKFLK